jgi:hypothetical protein
MDRLTALLLLCGCSALCGCGTQGLSRDVYDHEIAAAACEDRGDAACAAREFEQAERDRQKLSRREYAVPPTPFP